MLRRRLKYFLCLFYFYLKNLRHRIYRVVKHFYLLYFIVFYPGKLPIHYSYGILPKSLIWLIELLFLIGDMVGILELLIMVRFFFSLKSRSLSMEELKIIDIVYGNHIDCSIVKIFNNDKWISKKLGIAFVFGHWIFCWNGVNHKTLIHEMAHIWQYQTQGSVYILRALLAQRSTDGYKVEEKYLHKWLKMKEINQINYEQQAELFEFYYLSQVNIKLNDNTFFKLIQTLIPQLKCGFDNKVKNHV